MGKEFKDNIRFISGMILTTLLSATLIVLIFAQVGTSFVFDSRFWFRFITGAIITLLVITFWLPAGKEKGEKDNKYINNKKNYDDKANLIQSQQKHGRLADFCKYKTEQKKKERITMLLSSVVLDYDVYVKMIKEKWSVEDIEKKDDLNKHQKKVLSRLAIREIKHTRYNPKQITTGVDGYKDDGLKNKEKLRQIFYFASRIMTSFATMFFLASFIVQPKGVTMADVAQLMIWASAITTNLIGSYTYGIKLVTIYRNQYYLVLYDFLTEFEEWENKPPETPKIDETQKQENYKEEQKTSHTDELKPPDSDILINIKEKYILDTQKEDVT